MAIFEIGSNSITEVPLTSFREAGLRERSDLQRLLRDHIAVVAEDVLIIAEEFGEWTESRRRIDLLGVDKDGNLVVIELKRTEDGGHMELQALRYAAMVSTLTAERAIEIFGQYLEARGQEEDPEQALLEFLEWELLDEDQFAQDVRIILVAADFSRELTTAVMWLNERELDIRCVRIRPYTHNESTLIDVQQVIPLPEVEDYQVQVREKKRQEKQSRKSNADFTRYDITIDGVTHHGQWKRNAMLHVVKALCEGGNDPEEIGEALTPIRKYTWYFVEGTVEDVDEFRQKAESKAAAGGRAYDDRRWHTREGDLIAFAGKTYAFTNQWGRRFLEAIEILSNRFTEVEVLWSPSTKKQSSE